jgi:predicted component of type VI protein secretion system
MDFQLVVIQGRSASTAVKLPDGVTTAGRQEDCQLRIRSSQVSRKHCQLFEKHGMLLVKDLGSSNGTFVNGKKIEGQRVMEPGDELGIGPIVFRIERIGQAAPAKAAVAPGGKKPSDTAIAEGIAVAEAASEDEFEIDFDEEPTVAASADVLDDFDLDLDLDDAPADAAVPVEAAPAPVPPKKPASLADSIKPAPPKKEPEAPQPKEEPAMADDAVADFLLGIKLDDED